MSAGPEESPSSPPSPSLAARVSGALARPAGTRLFVVFCLGLVPWTVLVSRDLTFVMSFGLVNTGSLSVLTIPTYLDNIQGTARFLEAWLVGSLAYWLALGAAVWETTGRFDDSRLAGSLLALAAVSQFPLVFGWSRQFGRVGFPLGSVLMLGAAWWFYR